MRKHETVQNPLSPGELREWHTTILSQLPDNPGPAKVRADLANKKALGRDLGTFFRERYAVQSALSDTVSWTDFYRRTFDKEVDLSALHIPAKPDYPCWPIVMVPGVVSNNDAFAACKKQFDAWRYVDDLNTIHDVVERPKSPYIVWVKALVEADPELANTSAEQIAERKLDTLTLLERLVLELKYFDETKQHLDIENWTLCAGSRYADGHVPSVSWCSGFRRLYVLWYFARPADGSLRARAAVS